MTNENHNLKNKMNSKFMKWIILILNCLVVNAEIDDVPLREAGCFVPLTAYNITHQVPNVNETSNDQCPSVQIGLVTWKATARGDKAKVECPKSKSKTIFYATWQCDPINGCWNGYPNYLNCSTKALRIINNNINQKKTLNVTAELVKLTDSKMTVEDILLSSHILSKLNSSQEEYNVTRKLIENILSIGVNLISNKNSYTWANMTRDADVMCASSLMVAMETALVFALGKQKEDFNFSRVDNIFDVNKFSETQLLVKNVTTLKQSEKIFETQSRSVIVSIPNEIVAAANKDDDFVRMAFIAHRSVSNLLRGWIKMTNASTRVSSDVFSLSVGSVGRNTKLDRPIEFTMALIHDLKPDEVALCSVWKNTAENNYGYWSQDGCEVVPLKSNTSHITCQCHKMSSFAILVKQVEKNQTKEDTTASSKTITNMTNNELLQTTASTQADSMNLRMDEIITNLTATLAELRNNLTNRNVEILDESLALLEMFENANISQGLDFNSYLKIVNLTNMMIGVHPEVWENSSFEKPQNKFLKHFNSITADVLKSNITLFNEPIVEENIVLESGVVGDGIRFPKWDVESYARFSDSPDILNHAVLIPAEAFNNSSLRYILYLIRNNNNIFNIKQKSIKSNLNTSHNMLSNILAIKVEGHDGNLMFNATLNFTINGTDSSREFCIFLNTSSSHKENPFWSTEGCSVKWRNVSKVVCQCNHLTNFAVLMSFEPMKEHEELNLVSMIGCITSIAFLSCTLFVYFILWTYLKSERSIHTMSLSSCLLAGYILFLVGIDRTENEVICKVIASFLHYIFLSVFFNYLCQGLVLYKNVSNMSPRKYIPHFFAFSYGIPLVIVSVSLGLMKAEGHGTDRFCWLAPDRGAVWSFAGPALFVIVVNIIVLIKVVCATQSLVAMKNKSKHKKSMSVVRALCLLTPIFGLTWVFGVLSLLDNNEVFQYMFAVMNSLQGLFIFIVQVILNKKVMKGFYIWKRKMTAQKSVLTLTTSHGTKQPYLSSDL